MCPCGSDVSSQDGLNHQIFLKMAFGCRLKKKERETEKVFNSCKGTSSEGNNTSIRLPGTKHSQGCI